MARKRSKQSSKTDYAPFLIAAGGLALASLLSGGIKANVQTPSIIFAPPPINLSFPGFELPGNLYSPGGSGGTNQTFNFPSAPSIPESLSAPSIPSVDTKSILDPANKGLQDFLNSLNFGKVEQPTSPQIVIPQPSQTAGFLAIAKETATTGGFTPGYEGTKAFLTPSFTPVQQAVAVGGQVVAGAQTYQLGKSALTGSFIGLGESAIFKNAGTLTKGAATIIGKASPGLGLIGVGFGTGFAAGGLTAALEQYKNESTPESAGNVGAAVGALGGVPFALVPGIGPGLSIVGGLALGGVGYAGGYAFESIKDFLVPQGNKPVAANPGPSDSGGNVDNSPTMAPSSEADSQTTYYSSGGGKSKKTVVINTGGLTGNAAIVQSLKYQQFTQQYGGKYSPPSQSKFASQFGGFFK